jgi:hypothetical protein
MFAVRYVALVLVLLLAAIPQSWADPLLTLSKRVSSANDDAEQANDSSMSVGGSILSSGTNAWVGMRFQNITIPKNATITSATLTCQSAGWYTSSPAAITIFAQASDNASAFSSTFANISSRARSSASLTINPLSGYSDNLVLPTPDISALIQEVVGRPGWASGNALAILVRSDAAGERGIDSFDGSSTTAPLLTIEYTPYARPAAPNLLFVCTNASTPTTEELKREEWLKWWAYKVTRIAATDTSTNFNTAAAANDVAYVPETVTSTDLNTKLLSKPLGVVTDEPALIDDFQLAMSMASSGANPFSVASNAHYITSPFTVGSRPLFTTGTTSLEPVGTLAREAVFLGTFTNSAKAIVTIEAGGILVDNSKAAGRRVFLPWAASTAFANLNSDGLTIFKRSVEWAAGLETWWKLDETISTAAADSGRNVRNGTLNGTTFSSSSTAGKLGTALNLDGIDDYVSIGDHESLRLTKALSMSAWVYIDTFGANSDVDTILRKGDASPVSYQLCLQDGKVTLHLQETDATGAGTTGNTTLSAGGWYHVAATWDGTTALVYLNGIVDCSARTVTGPLSTDTRTLFLGGRSGGTDLTDGRIDDVRLYNYALTADEVLNLKRINQPRGIKVIKWVETQ